LTSVQCRWFIFGSETTNQTSAVQLVQQLKFLVTLKCQSEGRTIETVKVLAARG
jgi:hypothetical protein